VDNSYGNARARSRRGSSPVGQGQTWLERNCRVVCRRARYAAPPGCPRPGREPDSTEAVLSPVAVLVQVRCIVIPVLERQPRLGRAVSRVVAVIRAGCWRIRFLVGHARRRALSACFVEKLGVLFLMSLRVLNRRTTRAKGVRTSYEFWSKLWPSGPAGARCAGQRSRRRRLRRSPSVPDLSSPFRRPQAAISARCHAGWRRGGHPSEVELGSSWSAGDVISTRWGAGSH
jgi:hypothetical protein